MPVVLETFVPPTDITSPVITLLGNAQLAVTPDGITVMIHTLNIFTKWKDPGVVAVDDFDGNVTSKVLAWPAAFTSAMARPVSTVAVTPPGDPYVITYFVSDNAGNVAVGGSDTLRYTTLIAVSCESWGVGGIHQAAPCIGQSVRFS
jgi:hypothetical protein